MPTVHEVLKATGLTDEQIQAIGQKSLDAMGGVLTAAEGEKKAGVEALAKAESERQAAITATTKAEEERKAAAAAREAAESERRAAAEFYDTKINPALTSWENEKKALDTARINAESEVAFYKTQVEGAKTAGYIPKEAPAFALPNPINPVNPNPQRDPKTGQYVPAAPGSVPGSPTFTPEQLDERLGQGFSNFAWAMQEYQRLTGGQFLPDSVENLAREATNARLPFRDYVARKYEFQTKQAAINEQTQHAHDEKVRQEALAPMEAKIREAEDKAKQQLADNDKKWAERIGNNPDIRITQQSRYADIQRGVKNNERPDPLNLNEAQRRQATSSAIRQEITQGSAA